LKARTQFKENYSFSGHETFPFRLSWINKGVFAVSRDSSIFGRANAIVTLGVGKNMVKSIRHWCLTLGIIIESGRGLVEVTDFGARVFGREGLDPWLEDIGTLWILHWKLATNINRSTTWYYIFNRVTRTEFSKRAIVGELVDMAEYSGGKKPSVTTVSRDIDCFLRTYTISKRARSEEALECPLVDLGLVAEDGDVVWLIPGNRDSLPDSVFLYCLLEFRNIRRAGVSTLSIEQIVYAEGSPGRVFVMAEGSIIERLKRIEVKTEGKLVYDATAGLRQVIFRDDFVDGEEIIEHYYSGGQYELQ